ncbi:MAG: adenylosuccinate lyase [Chloroflexi bacterium]|nr:MAG: adenylosuccinate lyase [Chloroflexota bacterium]
MIPRYTRPEMARVWSDANKLDAWLKVEIAVCEGWAERGVIPAEAMEKIRRARYDPGRAAEYEREMHHDFNAFLRSVADSLGEESRFVHLGLTSNDIEDTALALCLIEATELLEQDIHGLMEALAVRAKEHKNTVCMGRSHGVHAEPTSFGLKLAAWYDEMRRNTHRLTQAKEQIAVGKISGPVGSHATVPPDLEEEVCGRLGLLVEPISTQVVHRDRHAYYISTLALVAAGLDKFATEIRHLQRTEVLEVEEPFSEGQTGTSSMPHTRNPEKCERISGLARLFRGYSVSALENIALWHERDISHSSVERVILPDACTLLDYMLDLFAFIIRGLQVYPERMRENLEASYGLPFSQRVLLALIEKGMNRQEAYKIVQSNAMRAWEQRTPYLELLAEDPAITSRLSREELESLFDYEFYLKHVDDSFARVGLLSS